MDREGIEPSGARLGRQPQPSSGPSLATKGLGSFALGFRIASQCSYNRGRFVFDGRIGPTAFWQGQIGMRKFDGNAANLCFPLLHTISQGSCRKRLLVGFRS